MRILLLDIESTPLIGYTWGLWEQNVIQKIQDSFILCVAYKWLGEGKVNIISQPDFPRYEKNKTDDKYVLLELWKVLDEADIVIAHNGMSFDLPKINARFITHGMTPPSPYKVIDTLRVSRNKFKFDSNKLDALGKTLGVGQKLEHEGIKLWLDCMSGDESAWKKMIKYNKQDVALLEEVYLKLRPWITNHPYIGNKPDECPNCHSEKLQSRGTQINKGGKVNYRFQCQDCGAWTHTKNNEKAKI